MIVLYNIFSLGMLVIAITSWLLGDLDNARFSIITSGLFCILSKIQGVNNG